MERFADNRKIRRATIADVAAITTLFRETVETVNAKDYSPDEIKAWASGADNMAAWEVRLREQYFIVAERDQQILGFSSIEHDGYLDFMYVHKDFQGCGIAKALLKEIENKAHKQGNTKVYAYVSKTAKAFFEHIGYRCSGERINSFKGVTFVNKIMEKKLS